MSSTLYFGEDFEIINNTSTLYIFAGNLRVAKTTDTTLDYYHKDHLGSTNAISRQDGTIIDSGEYLPYGLDRSVNALLQTSAYKFTDQEQDDGTGLYNYDARLYDPVIGQFVMADTLVPDQFNPQSLNRYVYCLDNPVKYIDPSGHNPAAAPIIGLIIGVLIGHYADPYLDNIDSFFKDLKDKIKDKEESEPEVFTFDIQDSPLNPDNQDNKSKSAEPADKKDGIPDPDTSDPDTSDSDTSGRGFSGPTGLGGR